MTKLLSKTVLALGLLVLSLSCNAQQIRINPGYIIGNNTNYLANLSTTGYALLGAVPGLPTAVINSVDYPGGVAQLVGPTLNGSTGFSGAILIQSPGSPLGLSINMGYSVSYFLSVASDGTIMINYTIIDGYNNSSGGNVSSGRNISTLPGYQHPGTGSSGGVPPTITVPGFSTPPIVLSSSYSSLVIGSGAAMPSDGTVTIGDWVVIDYTNGSGSTYHVTPPQLPQ